MPKPTNKELYEQVKKEIKKKYKVWPSAYASGALVKEYKKRGGKFYGVKKDSDLERWYKEKWVDVCYWPKVKSCGRKEGKSADKKDSTYPYCRPSVKVNSKTPKLVQKLTKKQRENLCKKKKGSPAKRVYHNKSKKPSKAKQCSGKTKSGDRCKNITTEKYCYLHRK